MPYKIFQGSYTEVENKINEFSEEKNIGIRSVEVSTAGTKHSIITTALVSYSNIKQ